MINGNDNVKILLEKYVSGTASAEERQLLDDWYEQTPVFDELTFVSEEEKNNVQEEIRHNILSRIKKEETVVPVHPGKTISLRQRPLYLGIAAALVALVAVVFAVRFISGSGAGSEITITAPAGVNFMPVTLPDESTVWLASGSTLHYPESFKSDLRNIELVQGSAFFQVQRNEQAPFIVNARNGISVKVLGTSFRVDAAENSDVIDVAVVTGRVEVDSKKEKLDVLSRGERLSYSFINKAVVKKDSYKVEEMAELTEKELVRFTNASIEDVTVVLQTIYKVKFTYDTQLAKQYKFNVSFSKSLSVDEVLELFGKISGLDFKRQNSEVTIKPK